MSDNLEDLVVALEAAVESYQDAAMILRAAVAVIEGHELGAASLSTSELRQALARLIQAALLDAECGRDLVQTWGERLAEPISESPGLACRASHLKAVV